MFRLESSEDGINWTVVGTAGTHHRLVNGLSEQLDPPRYQRLYNLRMGRLIGLWIDGRSTPTQTDLHRAQTPEQAELWWRWGECELIEEPGPVRPPREPMTPEQVAAMNAEIKAAAARAMKSRRRR